MHKESFIVNSNTLLHISTLLSHLQGEFFVIVTLRLHFIVTCKPGPQRVHASKNNAIHSQQHILTHL
jgi:hypothetical protein